MKIGILGGSFNPVHVAHLRLALEAREQVGLDRIDFVPTFIPPHKQKGWLLPFGIRAHLLEQALEGRTPFTVNRLEAERNGPSYTVHTLKEYHQREPGAQLYFVLGGDELLFLPEWYEWRRLLGMAHIVVSAREENFEERLERFFAEHLSQARKLETLPRSWLLPEGTSIVMIDMPRMDVSSTLIRTRWAEGRSLAWLVPEAVERYLDQLEGWSSE